MSAELWSAFLERVARHPPPLTETAARALLISCAAAEIPRSAQPLRLKRMMLHLAGPPAEPPTIIVRLAPELANRLSVPGKCDSHESAGAQREVLARAERELQREELLGLSLAFRQSLLPKEEPRPELDLGAFPSEDWEPAREPETFERIFTAIDRLLAPGPPVTVVFPAGCASFAAWEVLKVALLLRVACAPLTRPAFRLPPGLAALECRLLSLTSPAPTEFEVGNAAEWAEAAREFVRDTPALKATRAVLKRARFYLYGRTPEEARAVAQQTLEGDFRRFLYEELYPRIEQRRNQS